MPWTNGTTKTSSSTGLFYVKPATKNILLCAPQMKTLGQAIVSHSRAMTLGNITWAKFPDGFPNIFVHDVDKLKGSHITFLACFDSGEAIFEQMSVLLSLPQYGPHSIKIVLPFFPVGTMERVDIEGEIATARTLARILSNVPASRGGPQDLLIFDIHALQERFYFADSVVPVLESAVPLLLRKMDLLSADTFDMNTKEFQHFTIAFPDEGAYLRFSTMFPKQDQVICAKVRDGDKRKITVKEGNPVGKHVILVDDMIQSGGTLLECGKMLKAMGAAEVYAFCTHGVFPNKAWKKFVGGPFKRVWVTDSCPTQADELKGVEPFEVLSLAPLIADLLDANSGNGGDSKETEGKSGSSRLMSRL